MLLETRSFQFLGFQVDRATRTLKQGDQVLPVTGRTFDLLVYLVENPNRPLLKKELLDAVWPDSFVEESNLTQNVFVLRKALGSEGARAIKTLPGRGYQFVAEVTPVICDPEPAVASPAIATPALRLAATETRVIYHEETEERVPFWQSPVTLVFACVALVLFGVAAWLGWQRWEDRVGGPPVQLVLADTDGSTGDPVLDRTLGSILRVELAQSPFVTIVPAATVRQTMVQMQHKPDDPLTAQLAQDLCERTASQAVLRGMWARSGSHYVLTEEATNCVDGSSLGVAEQDVSQAEALPAAIEKLGASIRHDLGESRRTIRRFNQPLAAADTASIEALKDFSQANYVAQSGRFPEAIALLKQAVNIDPNFAAAYLNLSNFSANALDEASNREYLRKAYELRAGTTEPTRLFIAASYDKNIREDLYQSLRDYQAWIDLYPRSAQAWSGVAQVSRELGDSADELKAARHMKDLAPNNVVVYQALADAQMKTSDFAAARATCQLALSRGFDTENIRFLLLRLGYLTHDASLIAEQESWSGSHPDAAILLGNQATYAQQAGRFEDADKLLVEMAAAFRRQGSPQAAVPALQGAAAEYLDMGEDERGRNLLKSTTADPENYEDLFALALSGQRTEAAKYLQQQLDAHPQATLWNLRYAPLLRGELSLLAGDPQAAIAALEPTRQLDSQSLDGFYLRGKAYLAAHRLPEAEAEFQALLAHPEIEPNSYQISIAQLQLARAFALDGRTSAAVSAYQTFLGLWSHANGNPHILDQARRELAAQKAKYTRS
jgi:DNA-binding winged helix-turn-helix (wHTH) protein/tetratricopeptide (TPR) repeat protein